MHSGRVSLSIMADRPQLHPVESVQDADLRTLLAHWERMRNARVNEVMPLRAVASAEIGRLLKYMLLCDVMDEGADFRWRIIGIGAFPGLGDLIGQSVSQHPDMGVRLRYPIMMRAVVEGKKPVRGVALRQTSGGAYLAEFLWLPYGDTSVRQIMGMMVLQQAQREQIESLQAATA